MTQPCEQMEIIPLSMGKDNRDVSFLLTTKEQYIF